MDGAVFGFVVVVVLGEVFGDVVVVVDEVLAPTPDTCELDAALCA